MSTERIIKIQAKEKLSNNNWAGAIGAFFVAAAAVMAVIFFADMVELAVNSIFGHFDLFRFFGEDAESANGSISLFLYILGFILISPVFLGFLRYIYLTVKDEDVAFSEVFYYSGRKYFDALGKILYVFLRCLWRIIVAFLPAMLALAYVSYSTFDKDKLAFFDVICYVIVYALLFSGILLCMSMCRKYFMCFFVYIEYEDISAYHMCEASKWYMLRQGSDVMKLFLSLFPWILSCILVFPCIYVVPYLTAALSTSAKWIIALYEKDSGNKDE